MKFPDLSRALCREVGVEFFYPDEDNPRDITMYSAARKICSNCEVKDECLEWAVKHENFGMWGGTTPRERATIRRKRNIIIEQVQIGNFL